MWSHRLFEVDPHRDRIGAVGGEDAGGRFQEAHPDARDLGTELRSVSVETNDVDLGARSLRQRRRQEQLLVEREIGIDRDDSDVEVTPFAGSPRGLGAEEYGQPQRRTRGEGRTQPVADGFRERHVGKYAPWRGGWGWSREWTS